MTAPQFTPPDPGRNRRQAMIDLLAWIDMDATTKALDAIDLLELTDADIETLFSGCARVRRIPFLGRIA